MNNMKFSIIKRFLQRDIWGIDESTLRPVQRIGVWLLKRIIITTESFVDNNLSSFTAALTYSCMLAAVPVLSIVFAIARGFGFGSIIEERLRANVQLSDDIINTIFEFIEHYLDRAQGGVFVGFGLLLLIYTVVSLTSNIETAFNTIWQVKSSRNIYRRVINYVTVFLFLPILIVVTSGFSVFLVTFTSLFSDYVILSSTMEFVIQLIPVLLSGLTFIALYKLMPNTKVKWRATIGPGLIAGALFQAVQYAYIHYQIVLSSYNAVYGSFAALPMFMLWLQISWYICLLGAQLSYANQCASEYSFSKDSKHLSRRDHDSVVILLMSRICKRYADGLPPYNVHTLAGDTKLPHALVQGLLDEMVASRMLFETNDETGTRKHFLPAQDIHKISMDWIMSQLDLYGVGRMNKTWSLGNKEWDAIRELRGGISAHNGNTLVMDL